MQDKGKNPGFFLWISFTKNIHRQRLFYFFFSVCGLLKQQWWFRSVLFPLRWKMKAFLTFAFPLTSTLETGAVIVIPFSNYTKKENGQGQCHVILPVSSLGLHLKAASVKIGTLAFSSQPEHLKVKHEHN